MKKILLFILFIQSLTISAQIKEDYIPNDTIYFPPGTWWIQIEDEGYYSGYVHIVSDEKKIISNKEYYRIVYTYVDTPYGETVMGELKEWRKKSSVWIHEHDHKVYVLGHEGYPEDYLTYDFSDEGMEVGDTVPSFNFPIEHLGEIELLDGTICKTWDYEGWSCPWYTDPSTAGMLIQGIGHAGHLGILDWGMGRGEPQWYYRPGVELHSFFRRGQRIYRNPKFNFDLAEYIPANINSTNTSSIGDSTIYDLSGRKLTEKPQKGFYIQGGRKYIAR